MDFGRVASRSDVNVLILGPTGSGKTRLARQIHDRSARAGRPFVSVNLATLHEGTLESELFGHERGAFTGADGKRVGRLELAQGGTVFLDEIGELTGRLQARLLEFLQCKTIVPVGSNREIRLDVRVIAATHRDLRARVADGTFREDLFHRLRVVSLSLPALRSRPESFDEIVHQCLEDVCRENGRKILSLSEGFVRRLESYDWPGNFRELRNVIEFASIASENGHIDTCDLPPWFGERSGSPVVGGKTVGVAEVPLTFDFHDTVSRFEKDYLTLMLRHFGGRINLTARKTGLNKTTLLRRMRSFGITADGMYGGALEAGLGFHLKKMSL